MSPRRLIDRIPTDVRARAEKAGMTDVDWYAGRLLPEATLTKVTPERRAELRARAKALRRARRRRFWRLPAGPTNKEKP